MKHHIKFYEWRLRNDSGAGDIRQCWLPGIAGRQHLIIGFIKETAISVEWETVGWVNESLGNIISFQSETPDSSMDTIIGFRTDDPELATVIKLKFGI